MKEKNEIIPTEIVKAEENKERKSPRNIEVSTSQLIIMIELQESMRLPISLYFEISRYNHAKHKINIFFDEKDELLLQWFMEETLRREADKSYRGSDYYD